MKNCVSGVRCILWVTGADTQGGGSPLSQCTKKVRLAAMCCFSFKCMCRKKLVGPAEWPGRPLVVVVGVCVCVCVCVAAAAAASPFNAQPQTSDVCVRESVAQGFWCVCVCVANCFLLFLLWHSVLTQGQCYVVTQLIVKIQNLGYCAVPVPQRPNLSHCVH